MVSFSVVFEKCFQGNLTVLSNKKKIFVYHFINVKQ